MNANNMLKHTRNLLLCCIKIKSRTKLYMSYLGVNESEAFLKSFSIIMGHEHALTLSQKTNFRLFQTERLRRRQFQI